jgi:hypothetical protein
MQISGDELLVGDLKLSCHTIGPQNRNFIPVEMVQVQKL